MRNSIDDFMKTETKKYDRGYQVFISNSPYFPTQAVVIDQDLKRTMVDLEDADWDDGEDMADKAVQKYEEA